ncbi:MAG: ATP-binding protein, partial [Dehalococcoidia bacterium]|nr:ATP-binding protein [Dehalococcoidia bacterium]
GLLTTITRDYDRISMHGVRTALLEQQAESIGLPLIKVFISAKSSNEEYAAAMTEVLTRLKAQGINRVAFGDIWLEDVRRYREDNMAKVGMTGLFPLWGKGSAWVMETFIKLGFRAITTCVDTHVLDGKFSGRIIDRRFLAELPPGTDPAGEKGEFHSFVFGGPIFTRDIQFKAGETVLRDNRFHYCDLLTRESNK